MFAAAGEGDAQAVTAWLDEGGGLDARWSEKYGVTLLMAAAVGGQEAMVRMLLRLGASVNLQNSEGCTALMDAAADGHTTIVQALLDAKADASLQTISGSTALMMAERYKHPATAQLLRQHAKRQTTEAAAAAAHDAAAAPTPSLSGRRVRIDGLKGRPELNGRCGVAAYFDAAKERYEVAVEGEAEAVLMKPMDLQEVLEPALHPP
jgi:ankyrin repeat protein